MKESKDKLEKRLLFRAILISLLIILPIYFVLLIGYFMDILNGFVFVGLLFMILPITGLLMIIFRKNKYKYLFFIITFIFSLTLFSYESLLLGYEKHTFIVSDYSEPEEVLKDSGIHLLKVGFSNIYYLQDVKKVRDNLKSDGMQLFEVTKITNRNRYISKTNDLLNFIRTPQTDFERMSHNVTTFVGEDFPFINEFFTRDDLDGDSAGLALGLSAAFYQGKLVNTIQLGVTGTLESNGDVREIGSIKEKMMIAEQNKFPVVILPLENFKEAELIKKELNLTLQLIPVSHIDEAIAAINELNETTK